LVGEGSPALLDVLDGSNAAIGCIDPTLGAASFPRLPELQCRAEE
jgi:hypothetical protein